MRGLRWRKGAASRESRFERRREKNRKNNRWSRNIRERESDRRKSGDFKIGILVFALEADQYLYLVDFLPLFVLTAEVEMRPW